MDRGPYGELDRGDFKFWEKGLRERQRERRFVYGCEEMEENILRERESQRLREKREERERVIEERDFLFFYTGIPSLLVSPPARF